MLVFLQYNTKKIKRKNRIPVIFMLKYQIFKYI